MTPSFVPVYLRTGPVFLPAQFTLTRQVSAVVSQSALHEINVQALRARLESLDGVERALVDEARGGFVLLTGPDPDRPALEQEVRSAMSEEGVEPDSMPVEVVSHEPRPERHRVRFVGVERWLLPEARVRVRVSLEWNGQVHAAEEVGEASAPLEMRTAAAAVRAVEGISPEELHLRLIGIKQIRAFDQEITVVSLLRNTGSPQRLVGAVLTTENPLRTAALAVLNALNRVLGNYLSTTG